MQTRRREWPSGPRLRALTSWVTGIRWSYIERTEVARRRATRRAGWGPVTAASCTPYLTLLVIPVLCWFSVRFPKPEDDGRSYLAPPSWPRWLQGWLPPRLPWPCSSRPSRPGDGPGCGRASVADPSGRRPRGNRLRASALASGLTLAARRWGRCSPGCWRCMRYCRFACAFWLNPECLSARLSTAFQTFPYAVLATCVAGLAELLQETRARRRETDA